MPAVHGGYFNTLSVPGPEAVLAAWGSVFKTDTLAVAVT